MVVPQARPIMPSRNIELHRYRGKLASLATESSMGQFISQLLLALMWRPLGTCVSHLVAPLARILAAYLWAGRWAYVFGLHLTRSLLRVVGWLSGSPFSASSHRGDGRHHDRHALLIVRVYRFYFGSFEIKRWHLVIGKRHHHGMDRATVAPAPQVGNTVTVVPYAPW